MARNRSFSNRFWYDKHGNFVVWQRPNLLLWAWIIAMVLNIILPDGSLIRITSLAGGIAIFVWAALELGWGVNYFRRTLGACVLLLFLASHLL
jgi:hypothetical protein